MNKFLNLALMMAKLSAVSTHTVREEPHIEVPLTINQHDKIYMPKPFKRGTRHYRSLSQNKRRKLYRSNASIVNIKKHRKYKK